MRRTQCLSISCTVLLIASLLAPQANAQLILPGYRFKTIFTGSNKCLDIVNDGVNNKVTMVDCGN
jgi:hypothetical protein